MKVSFFPIVLIPKPQNRFEILDIGIRGDMQTAFAIITVCMLLQYSFSHRSNIFADADEELSPEEEAALQRFIAAYEIDWNEEATDTAPNVNSTRDQIARELWAQWILTGRDEEEVDAFMFG